MSTSRTHSLIALSLATALTGISLVGCGVRNQAQFRNKLQVVDGIETVMPGDGSSSQNLLAPTDKFGPLDPSNQKVEEPSVAPPTPPVVAPATAAPATAGSLAEVKTCSAKTCAFDLVTLDTVPDENLKVVPSNSNEKLIVSLSAILKIQKSVPTIEGTTLNLISARDVKIQGFDQTKCRLLAANFVSNFGSGFGSGETSQSIKFTLLGMDDKDKMNSEGCLVKLSELSMTGFVAEFEHVRVGGMLSETYVPKVRVNVAPHSGAGNR